MTFEFGDQVIVVEGSRIGLTGKIGLISGSAVNISTLDGSEFLGWFPSHHVRKVEPSAPVPTKLLHEDPPVNHIGGPVYLIANGKTWEVGKVTSWCTDGTCTVSIEGIATRYGLELDDAIPFPREAVPGLVADPSVIDVEVPSPWLDCLEVPSYADMAVAAASIGIYLVSSMPGDPGRPSVTIGFQNAKDALACLQALARAIEVFRDSEDKA